MRCFVVTLAFMIISALSILIMAKETNRRLSDVSPNDINIETIKPYKLTIVTVLVSIALIVLTTWCGFALSQDTKISIFTIIKIGLCCVVSLAAAVIDLKLRIIPNYLSLILILGRIVLVIFEFMFTQDAVGYLISSLIGGFTCVLVLIIANKLSKGGIGGGDIKLLACLGFVCGLHEVVTTMLLAVLICLVVSLALLLFKKLSTKDHLPFGPFIHLGFVAMSLLAVY